jgi:hypothetical protein
MKSFVTIIALMLYSSFQSFAQSSHPAIIHQLQQDHSKGKVQIVQDKRIDDFLSKIIENNTHKGTMPGYRVVIFRENSNKAINNAQGAKAKFYNSYSEIEAYLKIEAPNVWVFVGDFRTFTDALRMKKQLDPLFSTSRFVPAIVATEINISKL